MRDPVLHQIPNRPFVGVNVDAPAKAITRAVSDLVAKWKKQQEIGERRRRPELLGDYLRAWDLREGWVDGDYDPDWERSFAQVGAELHLPVTTAGNHWQSAFELLSGHPYTFDNWFRLFRVVKLHGGGTGRPARAAGVLGGTRRAGGWCTRWRSRRWPTGPTTVMAA